MANATGSERTDERTPAPAVYERRRTVIARDIDQLEHVNNVIWLRYVVELAHAHSTALGFNFDDDLRSGSVWVVRRHEIDYQRSAPLGAELVERTWVSHLHGARLVRESRFVLAQNDAPLVTARTLWAYVDAVTMRPKRIPREVAARFPVVADGERWSVNSDR